MRVYALLASLLFAAPAFAGTVAPGFTGTQLARNDDGFTGAIALGFSANFFGNTYSSTFVSNNGYLTFNAGQGNFSSTGLGAGYSGQPIIAAFFSDVDTGNPASGITSYGTGTYAGHNAFGATWPGVGYYSNGADRLNTFQIILTDRSDTGANNFDIYLNYDAIQWDQGGASAGYNAAQGGALGTFAELPGSQVSGAFLDGGSNALASSSNVGVPGQFVFNVRNGAVEPALVEVPEPASLMLLAGGLVALAVRRRVAA